ncbi:MAG: EamA family transporter [Sphingobacteriales bacterium]|nr:MAG: EamA family transporter [Sphingobacteriales bacterium]
MKIRNLAITLLAPVLWGTTYLVTTQFLPMERPLLFGALRALPVALLLMLFVRKLPSRDWWAKIFWLSVFNIFLFFGLFFYAAYRLPGGVAATLGAFNPFFVALFAWPILHKKPKKHTLIAAGLGIAGVAIMVLNPDEMLDWWGVFFAVAATLSIAPGTVLTKKWGLPDSPFVSTTWQLLIAGILLMIIALIVEGPLPKFNTENYLALGYLSFIATGLAYIAWFYGLEKIKPHIAAILTLSTPLVAVVLDWVILGKHLNLIQIGGGILILTSIIYEAFKQKKEDEEAKAKS